MRNDRTHKLPTDFTITKDCTNCITKLNCETRLIKQALYENSCLNAVELLCVLDTLLYTEESLLSCVVPGNYNNETKVKQKYLKNFLPMLNNVYNAYKEFDENKLSDANKDFIIERLTDTLDKLGLKQTFADLYLEPTKVVKDYKASRRNWEKAREKFFEER